MATKNILAKEQDKPSAVSDWNNSLKLLWTSDEQRPAIYSSGFGTLLERGMASVRERST